MLNMNEDTVENYMSMMTNRIQKPLLILMLMEIFATIKMLDTPDVCPGVISLDELSLKWT